MTRRRSFLVVAVTTLALVTAGSVSAAPKARLGREFTLRVGQTAVIAGEQLSVTFASVTEDSRCPTGVMCFWEGNAQIAVVVSKPRDEPETLLLNTNSSFPTSGTYFGYSVTLVHLDPYPSANRPIPQRRYRATLVVTEN